MYCHSIPWLLFHKNNVCLCRSLKNFRYWYIMRCCYLLFFILYRLGCIRVQIFSMLWACNYVGNNIAQSMRVVIILKYFINFLKKWGDVIHTNIRNPSITLPINISKKDSRWHWCLCFFYIYKWWIYPIHNYLFLDIPFISEIICDNK